MIDQLNNKNHNTVKYYKYNWGPVLDLGGSKFMANKQKIEKKVFEV